MGRYAYKIVFGSKERFEVEADSEVEAQRLGHLAWINSPLHRELGDYWIENVVVVRLDPGPSKAT